MTAARKRDRFKILFREQLGLGVLFHFFDGHIERPKQIERDLARRFEVGQISFLRIRLRPESIQRLIRFHDEFVSDGKPKYYGFPVRPRYREGGGCSEYAASYLEVGGVLLNEFCQAWQKTVLVPEPLIGGPASNRRVSMREILLSRHARQWASDINKHRPLTFWDPDLMHQWVERVWQSGGAGQYESLHFSCVKMQSARGLEIDLTHLPTPIEPLWLDARDLIKDETLGTS
jgi:hypothetical protein